MEEKHAAVLLIGGVIVISVLAFFLVQGLLSNPTPPSPPIYIPPVNIPPLIPPVSPPIIPPISSGTREGLIDSTTTTIPSGPACPSSTQRNIPAYVGSGAAMSLAAQDAIGLCNAARSACEAQNNIPCTVSYCQSMTTLSSTQKKQCLFNPTQADFVVGANGIPTKLGSGSCTTIQTSGTVSVRASGATQPDGWACGATLKTS